MIALFPHAGFLSETSRMLAIATALRARGESVVIATHGGPYTRVLDDAGVEYTRLTPEMDTARCRAFIDGVVSFGKPGPPLLTPDELRASVASEVAFLRQHEARVAVIGFTLSLYLSSRVAGIPLVTSHGGSMVPPVFEHGLMPTPTQAPAPFLDWLPRRLQRWMANNGAPRMRGPVAFLNSIADELGVERVPSLAALMLGDLTLVTDVADVLGVPESALEAWRPRDATQYRANTTLRYTGPIHARLSTPISARVQPFLDGSRPTAYIALTSTTAAFAREVIAGVRASGLRAIVADTGHALGDLAGPDLVVEELLPSHEIMPQVDVAVIMGGQGSVQTAMCSGTPFLGFPLHMEQELNVDLGVRQGMAIGIGPRHVTRLAVAAAVTRLARSKGYSEAAKRVQAMYAGIDGPGRAAEIIGHLRAGSPPPAPTRPTA